MGAEDLGNVSASTCGVYAVYTDCVHWLFIAKQPFCGNRSDVLVCIGSTLAAINIACTYTCNSTTVNSSMDLEFGRYMTAERRTVGAQTM